MATIVSEDVDITARTMDGEARGEGTDGLIAVACVLCNRVAIAKEYVKDNGKPHPLFGNGSFKSACIAKWQFSCWNWNDPNRAYILALTQADNIYMQCISIAAKAVAGSLLDVTNGATHYYDHRGPWPESWGEQKEPCYIYNHHSFFNNIA